MPLETSIFSCSTCGDDFTRLDHLTRHMRSHNADRPFVCPTCSKPFGRRDSLARHLRGHDIDKPGGHRTIFNRISRACTNCSKSKVRCDGQQPCQHCASKKLHCVREARQKRKSKLASSQDARSSTEPREPEGSVFGFPTRPSISLLVPDSGSSSPHQGLLRTLSSSDVSNLSNPATLATSSQNLMGSRAANHESPLLPTPKSPNGRHTVYSDIRSGEQGNLSIPDSSERRAEQLNREPRVSSNINLMDIDGVWDRQFNITDWMTMDFFDPLDFQLMGGEPIDPLLSNVTIPQTPYSQLQASRPSDVTAPSPGVESLPLLSNKEYQELLDQGLPGSADDPSAPHLHAANGNNKALPAVPPGRSRDSDPNTQNQNDFEPTGRQLHVLFPDVNDAELNILQAENFGHVNDISQAAYDEIVQGVAGVSSGNHTTQRLKISSFPSRGVLNCFVQLYFEYFQNVFPIVHQPTFDPSHSHWLEVLAVAAIGCRFSKAQQSLKYTHALLWLLRRSIHHVIELDDSSSRRQWVTTAMLLDNIGMMYSGDRRLLETGLVVGNAVATQCRRNDYFRGGPQAVNIDNTTSGLELERSWKVWVREESRRRIGFGCWILQCQLPLHFDLPASVRMAEMQQALPCPDPLWAATRASEWKPLFLQYQIIARSSPITIGPVLHDLIGHKRVSKAVGDFGILVLVHAIYEATFEMRVSLRNPLFRCLSGPSPLLEEANFLNWQSRAGAILEVLSPLGKMDGPSNNGHTDNVSNWQIRQYISASAHHVSLLVYAPVGDLLNYIGSDAESSEKRYAEEQLLIWAADDNGRTARRAVLHACIIFSLIRFRSCFNFHEPIAFLVATLTIWTYNHLAPIPISATQNRRQATIRLDKTWTREAAELWLDGEPETTRGYLTDIGNINEPNAGKRLLQVAHQSLIELPAWGLSQGFAKFLVSFQSKVNQ